MTTDEAATLQPGERVQIAYLPNTKGTVLKRTHNLIFINWDSGGFTTNLADCMHHIRRIEKEPHDHR
jgi:hypothetical protein